MKFTVTKPTEIDVQSIRITIPLRYDDDGGMAKDFPLRQGSQWDATVELESGEILDWPNDKTGDFEVYEKVCDEGIYRLLDDQGKEVGVRSHEYVPHGIVPGDYGDYIILKIHDGVITNWPRHPKLGDFFD